MAKTTKAANPKGSAPGSRGTQEAVQRIGRLPVSTGRAEDVREAYGLGPECEITHYDSLAAAVWEKAESSVSKDLAIFLRDSGGESPSALAKADKTDKSEKAGKADSVAAQSLQLRQEDLKQLSDEELQTLAAAAEQEVNRLAAEAPG